MYKLTQDSASHIIKAIGTNTYEALALKDLCTYHKQEQNNLNTLPYEIQLQVFSLIKPIKLLNLSKVCKEWKTLTRDPLIWNVFCQQLGLSYASLDRVSDYRFGLAFNKLKLKENLGEEIFFELQQMPVMEEEIQCTNENFEQNNIDKISDITKWQLEKDEEDHIEKKLVGNELFLIFITANRWQSAVYRFNLNFDPNSFKKNEYLYWLQEVSSISGFYLGKEESEQKRKLDLSCVWGHLQTALAKSLGLKEKETFDLQSFLVSHIDFNIQGDVPRNETDDELNNQ